VCVTLAEVESPTFETPRLLLRDWHPSDRAPFAAINADPLVMRYFPSTLNGEGSDAMVERNRLHFERHGFGLWAAAVRETNEFAGFIGLSVPSFETDFTPCIEIGWRLASCFWNKGLATEGASAVLRFAFDTLHLDQVVSFTVVENLPSRRVMEKIGMIRDLGGRLRSSADSQREPTLPTRTLPGARVQQQVGGQAT